MELFRVLRADEIDCRVQQVKKMSNGRYGCSVLLYKDARCDMNILDETVGAMNWQRSHTRDNANCIVSLWDKDKGIWISKEDVGTESNTEAAKGLASDSFKRACFNWGIGRELYTAPFIWITVHDNEVYEYSGKPRLNSGVTFRVQEIAYDSSRRIIRLVITDGNGSTRFSYGDRAPREQTISEDQADWVVHACQIVCGMDGWQSGLRRATGYDDPRAIKVSDFNTIKSRLEKAMEKAQMP